MFGKKKYIFSQERSKNLSAKNIKEKKKKTFSFIYFLQKKKCHFYRHSNVCLMGERKKCAENDDEGGKKNDVHQPHQTQRKSATIFKMVRDRQEREKEKEKKTLIGLAGRTLYVCVCMFVFFVFLI